MSTFFEEVFKDFKKKLEECLSEKIALTENYSAGEYQIAFYVSYVYWLSSNQVEPDLNSSMEKKNVPAGWGKFYHSTGILVLFLQINKKKILLFIYNISK